jgi:hypothetical protein
MKRQKKVMIDRRPDSISYLNQWANENKYMGIGQVFKKCVITKRQLIWVHKDLDK